MQAASSIAVWIVGLVFLVGGFAAGYIVGQGRDALLEDAPPPLERSTSPGAAASAVVTLERPTISAKEEAHLDSARAAELAPVRDLLAGMPAPTVPRGSGVITGTVRTQEGKGLAGVEITLDPREVNRDQPTPGETDAEELTVAVRAAIDRARWRHAARMRTHTSTDGTYRFDRVADVDHRIRAVMDGWKMEAAGERYRYRVRPGATVDFVARVAMRLPITIVLPDGTTPSAARIMRKQGSSFNFGSASSWTRARPYIELAPGTWDVTVIVDRGGQHRSAPQTVTVANGVAPTPLRFELESRGAIHGKVAYAPGERLSLGHVYLARIPEGQAPDPSRLATSDHQFPLLVSRGFPKTFTFSDLAPARYLLGLSRSSQGAVVVTKEVDVGDEAVEVVLEVPPLEREDYVVVTILGPGGGRVTGTRLSVGRQRGGTRSTRSATVVEREDGSRWVLHHDGDVLPEAAKATWWVQAKHAEFGIVVGRYERTGQATLALRFDEPGTLEVTVSGVAGTRYEDRVQVSLGSTPSTGRGALDARGRVTLSGLQPGSYDVSLSLDGTRMGRMQIHREKTEVRAGANRLRIALPALHEIEVVGVAGQAWIQSRAREGPRYLRTFKGSADGRATIDGLPAGNYSVRCGSKSTNFTLPGATTVRLE